MFDWLEVFLPLLLLKSIIGSICYVCLSFHRYAIGISERSRVKKYSAKISLLISLSVCIVSIICWNRIDKESLYILFPFSF